MAPLISILIPVYNVENYIKKCLISLFNNTYADKCEFIITDDCSTDSSIRIAHDVLSNYPSLNNNVKFLTHDINRGLAAARNTGIINATGKYILNVDSDDFVESDYIESFYKIALNTNADLITCGYFIESQNKTIEINQAFCKDNIECLQNIVNDTYKAFLWCKLFKRDIIIKNNIHWIENINMLEDFTFCSQYLPFTKSIYSINKCLYHYVQRENSYVHQLYTEKKVLNFINALNFIDNYLTTVFSKDTYENNFKEFISQRKLVTKYHVILEGSLYIQKKYFHIWPETYSSINNSNFGKITKYLLRKYITSKKFPYFLSLIHSLLLIKRGFLSLKQYLLRY